MNALRLIVLLLVLCVPAEASVWDTPGGVSDRLALTASYDLAKTEFTIILTNRSDGEVSVRVVPHRFHGRIVVAPHAGRTTEFLDAEFLQLLMTSEWMVAFRTLPPKGTITWVVPLSKLRDVHGHKLEERLLRGAAVHATLEEVAIVPPKGAVPPKGGYIASNAKQVSASLTLPGRPE